jgi:hypothetical protein
MRAALLLMLLASPALALAQAGRFLLAVGEVTLMRGSQEIPAAAGTAIATGDTVRVGARSGAQLRMSDETVIALRSNTVFRIDEHQHSGRGDESDRSVFSLVKGGMRAVTGAVARRPSEGTVRTAAVPETPSGPAPAPDFKPLSREESESGLLGLIKAPLRAAAGAVRPARHSVRLPTALVGIRGTHYTLVHCDNDCFVARRTSVAAAALAQSDSGSPGVGERAPNGSYGGISDGLLGVVNNRDDREFGANEFFYVASFDSSIQGLIGPPGFLYDTLDAQERNRGQSGPETTAAMLQSGFNADSRPGIPPIPPAPPIFVVTEKRNETGLPAVIVIPPKPSSRGSQGLTQGCPPFC